MNNLFKYITQCDFGSIELLFHYIPEDFKILNPEAYEKWGDFLSFIKSREDRIIVSNILEELSLYLKDNISQYDVFSYVSLPIMCRLYIESSLHISPAQLYSLYRSKYMEIYQFIKNSGRKDIDYEAEIVFRLVELIKKNVYNR